MASPAPIREWSRDNFSISTSQALIQPNAINAAFDSDFLYWAKGMPDEALKTMLSNSLCFGVYARPGPAIGSEDRAPSELTSPQIGLARLVTDQVTFAYLTDVYILPKYQKQGLGKWLICCVQEQLDSWPRLRGSLLYANQDEGLKFYQSTMGMKPWVQGRDGLVIMTRRFAGTALPLDD